MTAFIIKTFAQWPYDDALVFMEEARAQVTKDPSLIIIGIGSHKESVITMGKNPRLSIIHHHVLSKRKDILLRTIERGGGATIHEPGQVVLYPVLNIKFHRIYPSRLISILESALLRTFVRYGVAGTCSSLGPGIFIDGKKVAFIGLRIKNYITSHGMAVNVLNDGKLFGAIDPCGIAGLAITSLHRCAPNVELKQFFSCLSEDFQKELQKHLDA
ncbi:MAG: lipoyl(octanoyl) transferase LipB [Myxococcales bacterium]|nr:lipoyl(octanoyl) transferase LipB [Myxococcales bacterium]USN50535.1 MAG: lipoyl(octanoyl) transferase LipB [Myxococcales bacterium]